MPTDELQPEAPGTGEVERVGLGERVEAEIAALATELAELEMLLNQTRLEASRHEAKRAQAVEKVAAMVQAGGDPAALGELREQLVTLTRRATLMEAQVDVLEGKHKAISRFRDALAAYAPAIRAGAESGVELAPAAGAEPAADETPAVPPAVSRIILGAQEDLRREIARAMHDGPAQSLTNIVLQAQIVERLLGSDPAGARNEVHLLVGMVQQTLDATKSFIFDVRPMVLDDLGLVPTLRRAARERGRRAQVPVDFDSVGADRRLPVDLESNLFRILDEALSAYLSAGPDHVSLRLDWTDVLEAHVAAMRAMPAGTAEAAEAEPLPDASELPPALASMVDARRADRAAAAEAARNAAIVALPAGAWREIQQRAETAGITADLLAGGGELRLAVDVGPA